MEVGRHPRATGQARGRRCWLWSRGEELVTDRFPELARMGDALARRHGDRRRDRRLARRSRAAVRRAAEAHRTQDARRRSCCARSPVVLLAYDLLEWRGPRPARHAAARAPRAARRAGRASRSIRRSSPVADACSGRRWQDSRDSARPRVRRGVEGFMLKRRDARYGVGRTRTSGVWWKWKIDPTARRRRAGLRAARPRPAREPLHRLHLRGVGRRAPTAPTRKLVPFAKAYSGSTDAEMRERRRGRSAGPRSRSFGPVRSVKPTLVFELGFEGIAAQRAAQERHRRALPAHAALAPGQARRGGRHPANAGGLAAVMTTADARLPDNAAWTILAIHIPSSICASRPSTCSRRPRR